MTNSEDRDSLTELVSRMPIQETRGSLLTVIDKLLRVIDVSESSIMIPTLLKDKCEFDAYEMLTMAKILKASILGHNDLVEFYMSDSSSQLTSTHHIGKNHKQRYQQHQSLAQMETRRSSTSSTSASVSASTSSSAKSLRARQSTPLANHSINGSNNSSNHHHHRSASNQSHRHQRLSVTGNNNSEHLPSASSLSPSSTGSTSSSSLSSSLSPEETSNSNLTLLLHATPDSSSMTSSNSLSSSPSSASSSSVSSSGSTNSSSGNLKSHLSNGSAESDLTIKLLLQIETLKSFIPQVTELFEDIIELYKESVDTLP